MVEIRDYEKKNRKAECTVRQLTNEEKIKYGIKERNNNKKMTKELKIDEELRDWFPPLTKKEFEKLETDILRDGCRDSLCTWNGYIVDGHNRYTICTKHNIEFSVIELGYDTKEEVISWMVDTQLGRRNLTPIQMIAIAEKYRKRYELEARENLSKAGQSYSPKEGSANLPKVTSTVDTRKELATLAGVSERTYGKGTKILNSDNEDIKNKVLSGEYSIDKGYKEIFGDPKENKKEMEDEDIETQKTKNKQEEKPKQEQLPPQPTEKRCLKCGNTKDISEFKGNMDFCKECLKDINAPNKEKPIDYTNIDEEAASVIKDMKTKKNVMDYLDVSDELLGIKDSIQNQINIANEKIFNRYKLPEIMTQEDKNNFVSYMNEIINNITELKNKIKENN